MQQRVPFQSEKILRIRGIRIEQYIAQPQRETIHQQQTLRGILTQQGPGQEHGFFHSDPRGRSPTAMFGDPAGHFPVCVIRGSNVDDFPCATPRDVFRIATLSGTGAAKYQF